ncbi:MAG: UDP-N-acetylmuramoyl-tripeptide--D-alanyl-D-alanine ligase [Clostridiales bacterium]|nr:UDP-N-acetylmuramoyl-tripeptide--D-alanyl-D-alanine ligase [Clostridiales bacterium]
MILSILHSLAAAAGCLLAERILLHYFQLESYQFPGYFRTLKRNLFKSLLPGVCMAALTAVSLFVLRRLTGNAWLRLAAAAAVLAVGGYLTGKNCSEKHAKKAFVLTARVKRLYAVSAIVMTLVLRLAVFSAGENGTAADLAVILFPLFLPAWVALCGLLAWPVEKAISEMYFRDAQRILRERNDLIRIGITGSWGKTSVKFILGTILEEKYHTLVTPASFNTPMGVTKVIRSRLEPGHRFFVAEMGARHVGDIKEMCRLVHPRLGILTSVGPQHLDTFKTVERVAKTKYELINALPEEGEAFFADDHGICAELYEKTRIRKHLTGLDPERDEIWAEDIRYSPEGSSFILCTGEKRVPCETQLLGELNIRNILLCASVALSVGLSTEQIARGISKIAPVEHRLQLIRHPGGPSVIDDAFNSNIRGAQQAFQVLKQFPGKRMVITPGMVELGDREYEMNLEFGAAMAGCCDIAVLVGRKRSEAIAQGLKEKGFPEESIRVTGSLEEAAGVMRELAGAGDTVLFENDLPDNYTES